MDQERKSIRLICTVFIFCFMFIVINDWGVRAGIFPLIKDEWMLTIHMVIFEKFKGVLNQIKIGFTLLFVPLAVFTSPLKSKPPMTKKILYAVFAIFLFSILMAGYSKSLAWYTLYVYPMVIVFFAFANYTMLRYWIRTPLDWNSVDEASLKSVNKLKKEGISMYLETTDGQRMSILNPRQGIFVVGGAGSGKSASILIPLEYQAVQKNYAGIIYDFEGDPTEQGGAILTRHIINAKKKYPESNVKFAFINFVDLTTTYRCNPLARRYLLTPSGTIDKTAVLEIATVLTMNLDREGARKGDFWFKNMLSAFQGVIWRLVNGYDEEYCTIPHVVAILKENITDVVAWLELDDDARRIVAPIVGAVNRGAESQIAGVEATYQIPLNSLMLPEVFWVMSADEINLDITSKENPTLLCVGNSPSKQNALQAPISTILTTCKRLMNQLGKQHSIFMIDEAPTVYIDKLDVLPATARKKGVCTIVGVQTVKQLERDYGKENAKVLEQNLGNIFCGGNSDTEYSKNLETMFGDYDKKDKNYSETDQGSMTTSYNTKKDKLLSADKIMKQGPGHFSGKIFGGEPSVFSTQFTYIEDPENAIIPIVAESPLNHHSILSIDSEQRRSEVRGRVIMKKYNSIMDDAQRIVSGVIAQKADIASNDSAMDMLVNDIKS